MNKFFVIILFIFAMISVKLCTGGGKNKKYNTEKEKEQFIQKAKKSYEKTALDNVSEMNQSLPIKIDDIATLTSMEFSDGKFYYNLQISSIYVQNIEKELKQLEDNLTVLLCSSDGVKKAYDLTRDASLRFNTSMNDIFEQMEAGFVFQYFDESGKRFALIEIPLGSCEHLMQ
jgi:hypothetical protein